MPNISASTLEAHLNDICNVSPFLDSEIYDITKCSIVQFRDYVNASSARLHLVAKRFADLGYQTTFEGVPFLGFRSQNGYFSKSKKPEILLVAHHDYRAGKGADDNASGLAVLLQLAEFFKDKDLGLLFVSTDLEEHSLGGSERFANILSCKPPKPKYVICIDSIGSNSDICVSKAFCQTHSNDRSKFKEFTYCDEGIVNRLISVAEAFGHNLVKAYVVDSGNDALSFARYNLPVVSIGSFHNIGLRYDGGFLWLPNFAKVIHTNNDIPSNLSLDNLVKVSEIVASFIQKYSS
ncbi:MAG: M28 family peptidase [Candidatus Woesearchaeota archaeon]